MTELQHVESPPTANGLPANGLPASRQAAVEQGLALYHEVAAERDNLVKEVARLTSIISGYKVEAEAHQAQIASMESRVASATLIRDDAVAKREQYLAVLISIQAQLLAFEIPKSPLIKRADLVATRAEPEEDRYPH